MSRKSEIKRKTKETSISINFSLDGSGKNEIDTGMGFFNHMLDLFAKHGFFSLELKAEGDLQTGGHHTVEDVGIVLGQAIKEALGDKKQIKRYGTSHIPMDEALAMAVVDLSGRPFLAFDAAFTSEKVGEMETELVEEFFRAVAFHAAINLHIKVFYGTNNHHIIEAIFKAFARALDEASQKDARIEGVMSTKGVL